MCSLSSVQFSSVAQLCPILCDPMNHSTPGLPVHHQLPKFTQIHVHWVGDTIQPSHPLLSPSPPCPQSFPASGCFSMSQLFTSGDQSIGVSASTSVLPMNTQDWSPLGWTCWISLQSKGLSRLLQHCSLKALILRRSAFFNPHVTAGKTTASTRWAFVGGVSAQLNACD